MQVCTSLQTDNHASTPPLTSLQAGCPSCRPTNSVKALKALYPGRYNSRYCIKTTERMELLFGMEASSYLSHIALLGNLGISENYGTSLWMFV